MINFSRILFIHGSSGEKSRTYKATILRNLFPGMVIPDFDGDLKDRMEQLTGIISKKKDWVLIGSSLGGLMAALFTTQHSSQVRKLILLAPALVLPEFSKKLPLPLDVLTIIVHGTKDDLLPLEEVQSLAAQVFRNLRYIIVDDDHRLHKTSESLDWKTLVG